MKVFISYQIKNDENLASSFLNVLKKRGIDGIIASRKAKYDILIRDKIKEQINESDFLVAIITKASLKSASVHEEIGYAIGTETPIGLLVEEKLKEKEEGVFIYGHDYEYFERKFFEEDADIVAKYISEYTVKKKKKTEKVKKESIEKDQYEIVNKDQKLTNIKKDTLENFKLYGFKNFVKKLKSSGSYYGPTEINCVENKKIKQRFYLLFFTKPLTLEELGQIRSKINEYIFPNLTRNKNWLNMCMIIAYGNTTKSRIEKTYSQGYYLFSKTTQNTTVDIDNVTFYYGLGDSVKLDKTAANWAFYTSLPQFFITKIKSKSDIANKISKTLDFVYENTKIFKNVRKLKELEYRYQILPEKKRVELEKRREQKFKKKYGHRRAVRRRAAPRRPIRRGTRDY